ncbi:MAG TPA: ATP-binding protein [Stellaceae bacterium]|nr:ATP-binding protein [Stellaceae bacterium]
MVDHRLALAPDIAEIPRLLDWVETCCGNSAVAEDTAFRLALALEEAVANVIHHAFADMPPPHRIEVELAIGADRVSALVIDNGEPFDPSDAPEPDTTLPLEQRDPGGLGIRLIRRMMDRVDYRRVAGENRLRLEKART